MKNLWIVGIIVTWVIICVIGMLSWECKTDMYQGIILVMGICTAVCGFSSGFARQNDEYDEYGNYKVKW